MVLACSNVCLPRTSSQKAARNPVALGWPCVVAETDGRSVIRELTLYFLHSVFALLCGAAADCVLHLYVSD